MFNDELRLIVGIEIMKDMMDYKPDELNSLNFLENVIISFMVNEMYFNITLLSDDDTELILRSSEYARIHKGRF